MCCFVSFFISDNGRCNWAEFTGGGASPSGARYTSPLNVGIIIPMVVSVFLIVVICLLVIFIRRCRRLSCQARRAQRRQQRINTVSGTVSRQQRRECIRVLLCVCRICLCLHHCFIVLCVMCYMLCVCVCVCACVCGCVSV